MDELDELLAAAESADGLNRIDFRDPIAAFGAEAVDRLASWLDQPRLATFAVLTIVAAAAHDATAEAQAVLAAALPRLSGPVREDAEAALRRFRPLRSKARGHEVMGSAVAALAELRALVSDWKAAGRPPQPGVVWQQAAWIAEFLDHAPALRRLPARLDRASVRGVAAHATESETAAEMALLTSSGWGHGNRGYGWFRVGVAFGATDDPGARLLRAARVLATDGAMAGYRELGGRSRLFNLGPAFGTKFLFFCQDPTQRPRALIFDRNVADWLRTHAGLDLDPLPWSPKTYEAYLDQMHAWATKLEVDPDVVELVMFRSMAGPKSQWR